MNTWLLLAGAAAPCAVLCAIINYLWSKSDQDMLDTYVKSSSEFSFVTSRGNRLAVRTVRPPAGVRVRPNSIFIPNGMATTMVMIGQLQDKLAAAGFVSVAFDRYGCGFSDSNKEGKSPTVNETLQDMRAVYDACFPAVNHEAGERGRVILHGPSMGSIVGQCFVAAYPGLVSGFMNIDGVAHPFFKKRFLFEKMFGNIYTVEAFMARFGIFRPFLALARKKVAFIASDGVPLKVILAQLNQRKFWLNVSYEMKLMMDLCKYASDAWGPSFSMVNVADPSVRAALMQARPTRAGKEDETSHEWITSQESLQSTSPVPENIVRQLRGSRSDSALAREWAHLIVYVISARSYKGFGPFYPQVMRDWAQLEHAVQPLIGHERSIGRDTCPDLNHGSLFFNTMHSQVARAVEIDEILQQ